ncbi:MAG: hypothetical protein U1D55_01610 [Phycisphaerae bacterium]
MTLQSLETAPVIDAGTTWRCVVGDVERLHEMYSPLGKRLGLVCVRTPTEWDAFAACVPNPGPRPDFSQGILMGIASHIGQPVSGEWPIEIESVRVTEGAGLVSAHFQGGNYLPDGTTYLETTFVPDLRTVLVVDVNGVRFLPD